MEFLKENFDDLSEISKQYYLRNLQGIEFKTCTDCGKDLPLTLEYFGRRSDSKDGFKHRCKQCDSNYKQEHKENIKKLGRKYWNAHKDRLNKNKKIYRKNNIEKIKEQDKKYRLKHPESRKIQSQLRRARENHVAATLTSNEWNEIKEYFNNKCAYCGTETNLTQDHFVPVSKGGAYTKENIVPACISCNCSKNNKDFFEWYPTSEHYSTKRESRILSYVDGNKE